MLLPLAPGLLVRGSVGGGESGGRVQVPLHWLPPGATTPAWWSVEEALRECNRRRARAEGVAEREMEAVAAQESSEGAVRGRVAQRAEVYALLQDALGGGKVSYRGDNVVEVKEENGESRVYITETLPEEGGGGAGVDAPLRPPPKQKHAPTLPPIDPARQRAIMKRLEYLEAVEAGRGGEWKDAEGKEPLPPYTGVLPTPPLPPPVVDRGSSSSSGGSKTDYPVSAQPPPSSGGEAEAPPRGMSLFKQRQLAKGLK